MDGNSSLTLALVFLFSLKRFPFDSRPQTSLGEGMLLKADREIGTDYQLNKQKEKKVLESQVARKTGVRFSKVPVLTFQGSFSRKTRNFSGPKNCFMFAVLAFKIKVKIILKMIK